MAPHGEIFHVHHIVPFHDGGTSKPWNKVILPSKAHFFDHYLRFLWLKQPADQMPLVLLSSPSLRIAEKQKVIHKTSDPANRRNKVGIYNAATQVRATVAAVIVNRAKGLERFQTFFEAGMLWTHKSSGCEITIVPGSPVNMSLLTNVFLGKLKKGT